MRILFIIPSLCNGGAERVTANLANHWAAKGWEITIITFAPRDLDFYELHASITRLELNLADLGGNVAGIFWKNLRRVRALRHFLRENVPDVALSMMSEANVLLALSAWRLPAVCAIGSERTFAPLSSLGLIRETLRRYSFGQLAAVVALTQECAAWIKAHTTARRVVVIPNPVLWPMPEHAPRIAPTSLFSTERKLLLAVGRLSTEKNFGVLVDVFSLLAQDHRGWDLVFIGEGPERAALEAKVHAAGLEGRVSLPGRVGNVGAWYERADIYVLTSLFEGFPNSLAEALAHGLPAVSFDCDTGPRDIIRHGVDGLLVPPGDADTLRTALDRLMGDEPLRKQYAERAIEARERFSMERIAEMWEKIIMEVKY
jgi:glycosyltransferase involved in cell wall biosynthesis